MILKKIFILLTLSVITALGAAEVGEVKFIQQGSDPVPDDILSASLRLRPGVEFKKEFMDEDLKNLYNSGRVSDATAEFSTLPDGKIAVVYKLTPSPMISIFKIHIFHVQKFYYKKNIHINVIFGQLELFYFI